MALKVVQWATGGLGVAAIRGIAEHPDLELAGCWVHSAAKAGRDAGEIAGIGKLGVTATNSIDDILALDDGRGVVGDGGTVERLANALLKGGRQHGNTRQSAWQNSPGREGKARALRRASLSARRWTDLQRAIALPPRASAGRARRG